MSLRDQQDSHNIIVPLVAGLNVIRAYDPNTGGIDGPGRDRVSLSADWVTQPEDTSECLPESATERFLELHLDASVTESLVLAENTEENPLPAHRVGEVLQWRSLVKDRVATSIPELDEDGALIGYPRVVSYQPFFPVAVDFRITGDPEHTCGGLPPAPEEPGGEDPGGEDPGGEDPGEGEPLPTDPNDVQTWLSTLRFEQVDVDHTPDKMYTHFVTWDWITTMIEWLRTAADSYGATTAWSYFQSIRDQIVNPDTYSRYVLLAPGETLADSSFTFTYLETPQEEGMYAFDYGAYSAGYGVSLADSTEVYIVMTEPVPTIQFFKGYSLQSLSITSPDVLPAGPKTSWPGFGVRLPSAVATSPDVPDAVATVHLMGKRIVTGIRNHLFTLTGYPLPEGVLPEEFE